MLILDLQLPQIGGLEALERIRRKEMHDLPIVILTSSAQTPDIQKAYALGANSFVTKPVAAEAFQQAVQSLGMYWALVNKRT